MTVSVFTGKDALLKLHGKKKVLSNKALTRRVRGLSGQEGQRVQTLSQPFNNITLDASTATIAYVGEFNALTNDLIHKLRINIHCVTNEDSTLRIILFEDNQPRTDEAEAVSILSTIVDTWSAYAIGVHPVGAGRNTKNIEGHPRRIRILRDMLVSQSLNDRSERYVRLMDVNYFNRKKTLENFEIALLVMSTGTPLVDIQILIDHTDLDGP